MRPKVTRKVQEVFKNHGLPGWRLAAVSAIDAKGRTIWIADAHRGDGQRFVVHADEILTAFLELERAVCIQLLSEHADYIVTTTESVLLRVRMKS